MHKLTLSIISILVIAIFLPACQALSFQTQPSNLPVPLSGTRASRLGASALLVRQGDISDHLTITPISAATGKPSGDPIEIGTPYQVGFSANRELMAVISDQLSPPCLGKCLQIVDLRAWKVQAPPIQLKSYVSYASGIAFTPDGKRLAIALNDQGGNSGSVHLVDIQQGKELQSVSVPMNNFQLGRMENGSWVVYGYGTSADGKDLLLRVAVLDGDTLQTRWQQDVPEALGMQEFSDPPTDPSQGRYLSPATALSADHSRLYVVPADTDKLVTLDFMAKTIRSQPIQPKLSWFDRLLAATSSVASAKTLNGISKDAVLSPDGKMLYIVGQESKAVKDQNGNWMAQFTPLGLKVVDTATGTLLTDLKTDATYLSISPDGKWLFLTGWNNTENGMSSPWTDILGLPTRQLIRHIGAEVKPTRLLDGSLAWLASAYQPDTTSRMAIYRPGQEAPLSNWIEPGVSFIDWIAVP